MEAIEFNGDGEDVDEFSQSVKGVFHLDGCLNDYTLCGVTLDGDPNTAGGFSIVKVKAINCPYCVKIIKHCRGVRVTDS